MAVMTTEMVSARFGRAEFPIWGGRAVVAVSERAGLAAALAHVKRTVASFDRACSSFRDDSELALLNASPREEVVVSPLLFAAVREALRGARLTGGAVDPTVGQALVAHRINPALSRRPATVAPAPGYEVVRLDEAAQTIRLPVGVQLDLGATAKALAADMAAAAAATASGCGALVGLCGDVAIAGTPPDGGWEVRVDDDLPSQASSGQMVRIRTGGLATSRVSVRRTGAGPAAVHHLIDPATGLRVDGPWRAASVSADSCLEANTASTAAIVLGAGAPDWLRAQRLSARLVGCDNTVRHIAAWPQEDEEL